MLDLESMLQAERDALIAILPRVNVMNSFIRSEAHRRHSVSSSLAYVVYHYKREAIMAADRLGMATHRRAQVPAKCNRCGGTGRYTDRNGYTWPDCLHCTGGFARLEFVETKLPGFCWLTPRRQSWEFRLKFEDLPETEQNWQVNQPGQDLTPSQVADHLNEIEAFFPKRPPTQRGEWSDFDIYGTYSIWVGQTRQDRCLICGVDIDEPYGGHGIFTGRVAWNACVCRACEAQHRDAAIFNVLATRLPLEFITPEIRRWMERHPAPAPKPRVSQPVWRGSGSFSGADNDIHF